MSSNNAAMENALLEVAKDLLQASDELAPTDPQASAKLAHEAYEIGRDLGVVRNHTDEADDVEDLTDIEMSLADIEEELLTKKVDEHLDAGPVIEPISLRHDGEDDSDDDLLRILDRQKALLPETAKPTPVKQPSRGFQSPAFESVPPRRSSWFGWMRSREWRHAG